MQKEQNNYFACINAFNEAFDKANKPIFITKSNSKKIQIIHNSNYTQLIKPIDNKGMVSKQEETMRNIRKRKNGLYEGRFNKNNKTYSVYARSISEINKKLKELKKELLSQSLVSKKLTLKEYYERWLDLYKKNFVKESSLKNIKMYFKAFILPKFGNTQLEQLTQDSIQTFLNTLQKNRTKELIITYFKALIKKAFQEKFIKSNPFDLIVTEKKIKKVRQSFNLEEQIKILNVYKEQCSKEEYELILFYLLTGVRRNEALNLDLSKSKNNKLHINGTKTLNSDRWIKISENYMNRLQKNNFKFSFSPENITKKFKAILNQLSIKGCLNCLRHTYATNMFYLGANTKFVQTQMGHSSYQITADIYTNLHEEKPNLKELISLYENLYYFE